MTAPGSSAPDGAPSATDLERAIALVPGVSSAEVSPGDNGRDRLRISLAPGEDPESVAWTVAATLRERFAIALDPAAITARIIDREEDTVRDGSIQVAPAGADHVTAEDDATAAPAASATDAAPEPAAVPEPDGVPSPEPSAGEPTPTGVGAVTPFGTNVEVAGRRHRAVITELLARLDGDELAVTARLQLSGREVVGRARGVPTRRGRWRTISEATLDALASLSSPRVRGHVDHVAVLPTSDLAHVSVSVTLLTERGEETFLGAALVRDDADRAVMRATLDAVNRRVEPWLAAPVPASAAG